MLVFMAAVSAPAPGRLETVRRFVNTLDVETGTDTLTTGDELAAWLSEAGLAVGDHRPDDPDVGRAVAVREALRAALAANHDAGPIPEQALATLNDAASRAGLTLTLTSAGEWVARPSATGVDGALGALLALVDSAMREQTWSRLKVCVNDACRWAFYDHSRARSGKWCSMKICGNRAKQQAWRSRTAESSG